METQSTLPIPDTLAGRDMAEFLLEVLIPSNGCPLCRAADRDELDLFYTIVADVGTQDWSPILADGPMCNYHAAQLPKVSSSVGTARLCRHLLLEQLDNNAAPESAMLPCPLCRLLHDRQVAWTRELSLLVQQPDIGDKYVAGDGLCTPHRNAATVFLDTGPLVNLFQAHCRSHSERFLSGLDLLIEKGYFAVPWEVAGVYKRAREHLFGLPGLTNYLLLPHELAISSSAVPALSVETAGRSARRFIPPAGSGTAR